LEEVVSDGDTRHAGADDEDVGFGWEMRGAAVSLEWVRWSAPEGGGGGSGRVGEVGGEDWRNFWGY
jgi:hypothetical protein